MAVGVGGGKTLNPASSLSNPGVGVVSHLLGPSLLENPMLTEDRLQEIFSYLQDEGILREDLVKLAALRNQIVALFHPGQTERHRQHQIRKILQLIEAGFSLSKMSKVEDVILLACWYINQLIDADGCAFMKWMPREQRFVPLASFGGIEKMIRPDNSTGQDPVYDYSYLEKSIQDQRPYQLRRENPELTSQERAVLDRMEANGILLLPIFSATKLVGVMQAIDSSDRGKYPQLIIVLSQIMVDYTGIVIARARMYENAQKRARELETLRRASIMLTSSLDLRKVLDSILASTHEIIPFAHNTHIFLYENGKLEFGAALWADGKKGKVFANPRPQGLTYTTARKGEIIQVNDMRNHPLFEDAPKSWQGSILGLPLKIGDAVVGVMTVAHLETHAFSKSMIPILQLLGDQAAVAIENARLHKLVNQQAHTDILTDLPNRRALRDRFEQELCRSQRYQHPFCLVMMDLDNFKRINDNHGHPTGDRFLQKLSAHMQNSIRKIDYLARYGGDEFALLLPETDARTTQRIAIRLQDAVKMFEFPVEEQDKISISVSFGCAVYPEDGNSFQALLEAADRRLYSEKKYN